MRAWLILARPAASPRRRSPDRRTLDDRSGAQPLAFSAEQIGARRRGRIAAWTGEIVLDPQRLAAARIDIRMDMRSDDRPAPGRRRHAARAQLPRCRTKCPRRASCDRGHRERRRSLRGARQAHDPRRHARRRAALHACHRRDGQADARAARSASSGSTSASARTNGRRPARSPTRSRSTSPSWRSRQMMARAPAARRRRRFSRVRRAPNPACGRNGSAAMPAPALLPLDPARGHLSAARASACRSRRSRALRRLFHHPRRGWRRRGLAAHRRRPDADRRPGRDAALRPADRRRRQADRRPGPARAALGDA